MQKTLIQRITELNLAQPIAIVGAGVTGRSAFDLLNAADIASVVLDESDAVPVRFEDVPNCVVSGALTSKSLAIYETLIVSPGVDLRRVEFGDVQSKVLSDTELFARLATKPIIGVTGSNGKSTVVSLLADAMTKAGKSVALCGNIGLGMLSALAVDEDVDYYVVELSSYQLEVAPSLQMEVGVLLNISPDHLDRYDSYQDYANTKARVLSQATKKVTNANDEQVVEYAKAHDMVSTFGDAKSDGVWYDEETVYLGDNVLFNMCEFSLVGKHNTANVASVFTVANVLGLDLVKVADACREFKGLPSRSVLVADIDGVQFINDSKGTNVGATVAALNGLSRPIILLAGGQGKGQDFSPLVDASKDKVKYTAVFGEDKQLLAEVLTSVTSVDVVETLEEAFSSAVSKAASGDVVLLSPACASFDQFPSYLKRGEAFESLVREYEKGKS